PGDRRAGRRGRVPHRRDRGADALLQGSLAGELRRLVDLRPPHPHRVLLVHAASQRRPPLPPVLEPARPLPPAAVTRPAARALDAAAGVALAGGIAAAALGRGRPEDCIVAATIVVALRAWLMPFDLRRAAGAPRRTLALGVLAYVAA